MTKLDPAVRRTLVNFIYATIETAQIYGDMGDIAREHLRESVMKFERLLLTRGVCAEAIEQLLFVENALRRHGFADKDTRTQFYEKLADAKDLLSRLLDEAIKQ